jgi:hypothetical protein
MSIGWDYVSELRLPAGLLVIPQVMCEYGEPRGMILTGKEEELTEKPVAMQIYPAQIPYGLTRARTRDSAVRDRRPTAWAMARPIIRVSFRC